MVRIARRLLLPAATASCLIALLASAATANRLSVSERFFELRSVNFELAGPTGTVQCPITLLGSFHSATIVKTPGLLIGYINHARVGSGTQCTNGRMTVLQETLPWHVRYLSFTGRLPRISTIKKNVIRASFRLQVGAAEGPTCLATTTVAEPANGHINIEAGGTATSVTAEGQIDLAPSPDTLCDFLGANATISGVARVENLRGGALTARLI